MPTCLADDQTALYYEVVGAGEPLICLPGGPWLPAGEVVVQPGAGHFPWVDDAEWFAAAAKYLEG